MSRKLYRALNKAQQAMSECRNALYLYHIGRASEIQVRGLEALTHAELGTMMRKNANLIVRALGRYERDRRRTAAKAKYIYLQVLPRVMVTD